MKTDKTRRIVVDYLARVEGEGKLVIELAGDHTTTQLAIFEPPRFFEALLRGRAAAEAPDITSRICGICPVAYQMSACHAVEDALGIHVTGPLRELRRLLYAGEWIESHGLHVFMLHAPDFLGYPDAIAMSQREGEWVRKGLRIKKAGNSIVARLGGREIHPINIRIGGFFRTPPAAELAELLPELAWGRDACAECLDWAASFTYPELDRDYELVALRHPHEYPFCEGRIVSSRGLDVDVADFERSIEEYQVPYSNALHARMRGRGPYLCGPLARFNLCFDQLSPAIQALAERAGVRPPCTNPFRTILIRLVEMAHAFEEAIRVIEHYTPPVGLMASGMAERPRVAGHGATEAPRGLLYHRYELDGERIAAAKIIPPTSQNQAAIEADLHALAGELVARPHADATHLAEQAIRNHDPCISCATHFLDLEIRRT